jgi:putative flavoprotein involved in K+ transport
MGTAETGAESGLARERFPVVIVGAGQAGLAAGYYLARARVPFVILDAGHRIGDSWRNRWGSLRLFTPARIDGLPGLRFPASPSDLPSKDAMADYLETYAAHFKLPVRSGVRVTALDDVDGHYLLTAAAEQVEADQVIVATGANQTPHIPAFAADLAPEIVQLSAGDYTRPAQLRPGGVLVVGAGNSGAEIALEAAKAHQTWLSGRSTGTTSSAIFTPPLWWVAMHVLTNSTPAGRRVIARMASRGAPWLRINGEDLTAARIERVARTVGVEDGKPRLEDGRVLDVSNVVWCSGFGQDDRWIHLPVFDAEGGPVHERGVVTSQPGLYFLGRPYLYGVTSALIGGVGRDAAFLTRHVVKRSGSSTLRGK